MVDRFTRVDDKTLLYRFTIEEPATWTQPRTSEYTWPATEGNYALTDILKGAAAGERTDRIRGEVRAGEVSK